MGDVRTDPFGDQIFGVFKESLECDVAYTESFYQHRVIDAGERPRRVYFEGIVDPKLGLICLPKNISNDPPRNEDETAASDKWAEHVQKERLTIKCPSEYVRICARFEAIAGNPPFMGQTRLSTWNPRSIAELIAGCVKVL
jgi:hypothetical protein